MRFININQGKPRVRSPWPRKAYDWTNLSCVLRNSAQLQLQVRIVITTQLTLNSSHLFKIATNSAISQASRFRCKQQAVGPEVQTVEKRKAFEEQGTSSKKARTQRPRQKACALFTLHVDLSAEISEAIDFLENDFDITTFKPEGASGKNEKRLEQLNRLPCNVCCSIVKYLKKKHFEFHSRYITYKTCGLF